MDAWCLATKPAGYIRYRPLTVEPISELKIGDNINATPAILGGRIYIGAFNGKLYCLK